MSSAKGPMWRAGGAWVARGLRVTAAVAVVLLAFGLVAVRVSYARATQAGLDFGDELRQMGEHHLSGDLGSDAYEVLLNGQPLHASNAVTQHPMHEVLDYFQAECQNDGQGLREQFTHLDAAVSALAPTSGVPGFLTIRREQDDRGFVFCMAADHQLTGPEEIMRVKSVGSSWDISKIGDVRYVTVRKDGDYSYVVAAWTRGKFDIHSMFPKTGDAPGEDFGNVPRPDGSRRILTGTVTGAPFGVNSYEVAGAPEEVLKSVDGKLLAAGYKPVTMPKNVPQVSRFYSLGSALDVGVTTTEAHMGKTDVSYIVSRGIGTVTR
jgi:hypothetical protein